MVGRRVLVQIKVIYILTAGTIALLIFIQPPKSITDNDRAMDDSEISCKGYTTLPLFIFRVTTWNDANLYQETTVFFCMIGVIFMLNWKIKLQSLRNIHTKVELIALLRCCNAGRLLHVSWLSYPVFFFIKYQKVSILSCFRCITTIYIHIYL